MAVYASIIVPTHDRSETLPWSIQSALAQTVDDIEVLVVGDGCTEGVRDIATSFAARDPRVRFLDLPKAPLRGAKNRHAAVLSAKADRIFYNDDDDLLLPWHVQTLGNALDKHDVVDTPAVSVSTDGQFMAGVHDSSHPVIRDLLNRELYKGVFDTHLAHRKAAYISGGGAWLRACDKRVVLHMLKHFLSTDDLSWRTLNEITALSFHGMARTGMPGMERAREIENCCAGIAGIEQVELRERCSVSFHMHRLLRVLQTSGAPNVIDDLLEVSHLTELQTAEVTALRAVFSGSIIGEAEAARVLNGLLDGRLGPVEPVEGYVDLFLGTFSSEALHAILEGCTQRATVDLARFHLCIAGGLSVEHAANAASACWHASPIYRQPYVGHSIAKGFARNREYVAAWQWLERVMPAIQETRHSAGYWNTRKNVALKLGKQNEADIASARHASVIEMMQ